MSVNELAGSIVGVSGPVVIMKMNREANPVMMNELVFVSERRLIGEVGDISGEYATIEVYEDTTGLSRNEPVYGSRELFSVRLGPGLLGSIYDGLQRPLESIAQETGSFIQPGARAPRLSKEKKWDFEPVAEGGERLGPGDTLGLVEENEIIKHRIMVPPGVEGTVTNISDEGTFTVDETIAVLRTRSGLTQLSLSHSWPIRRARPYNRKLAPNEQLIVGQRVLDTMVPVAKGGIVAVAGGFGTGKTILQHQLARYVDADIVIYVGCGERGNEISDLLNKFSEFRDPKTGFPLLKRSIVIANTSNMPVAAREASVYTGATIAEYYRDMGYDVALLVDSTSRWAEALREISSRQGELPGEEGYPPYLASRIARFYGRAGKVETLGTEGRIGSLSLIASVSPSGGDFSEPVTQKTLQVARAFWALDPELAYRRHYPAINLQQSFSFYVPSVEFYWYEEVNENWRKVRDSALELYGEKLELERVARLVGVGALTGSERVVLRNAELLEEVFLKQNALHPVDGYCSPQKQFQLLDLVMAFHRSCVEALEKGVLAEPLIESPLRKELESLKFLPDDKMKEAYWAMGARIRAHLMRLVRMHA